MHKITFVALIIGFAFMLSLVPQVSAVPTADQKTQVAPVIAFEIGSYYSGAKYLDPVIEKCEDWGYTVKTLLYNATYDLTGVDVLVIGPMNGEQNVTQANLDIITAWFETGNKKLWIAGDSDYSGYGAPGDVTAHYSNAVIEAVNGSLVMEKGAVSSWWCDKTWGAPNQRVWGCKYGATTEAAKLVDNLPNNKSTFHGPSAVLWKDAEDNLHEFNETLPTGIEWVVKAADGSAFAIQSATPAPQYQFHTNGELYDDLTLMAIQKWTNGNVLVVSGEAIYSTYKAMFGNPTEYDNVIQSSVVLAYNTLLYLGGLTLSDTSAPKTYDMTITVVDNETGEIAIEFKGWDKTPGSGICYYGFYNDTEQVYFYPEYDTNFDTSTDKISFSLTGYFDNVTQDFSIVSMDYAGNFGEHDDDFDPTATDGGDGEESSSSTTTTDGTPGFEFLAVIVAAVGIVCMRRRE